MLLKAEPFQEANQIQYNHHVERIGQRIAQQRRAYGLTQAQLAEKADVFPETISRIETGHRTASLGLLVRVADAIEVDLHELFRLRGSDSHKDVAKDRLLWFASRLSAPEIEHLLEIGAAVFASSRRGQLESPWFRATFWKELDTY